MRRAPEKQPQLSMGNNRDDKSNEETESFILKHSRRRRQEVVGSSKDLHLEGYFRGHKLQD